MSGWAQESEYKKGLHGAALQPLDDVGGDVAPPHIYIPNMSSPRTMPTRLGRFMPKMAAE